MPKKEKDIMFIHFVPNSDFEAAPCPCPDMISSAKTPFQVPIQPVLVYMYVLVQLYHTILFHHPLPTILHIVSRVKKKPRSREQSSVELQAAPPPENCNLWRILRTQRPSPHSTLKKNLTNKSLSTRASFLCTFPLDENKKT